MIIACPDCTGPFELRDGDVAELVQLECPHCRFRMILDFAAANDPRLVEVGMKMASGYRSAAEYSAATAGRTPLHVAEVATAAAGVAAANELAEAAAVREAEAAHAAAAQAEAARVAAARAAEAEATAARAIHIAADPEWDDDEAAPTRVARLPVTPPATTTPRAEPRRAEPTTPASAAPSTRPARTGDTIIGPAPRAAESARPSDETTEPARRRDEVVARSADEGGARQPSRRRSTGVPAEAGAPAARTSDDRPARRAAEPVVLPDTDLDVGPERRQGGVLGAMILVMLLVLAVGITIASVIRKGTPDPRPLLEDLYRQYVQK